MVNHIKQYRRIEAIRHFYDMNDIVSINWKKVHSFEGEHEKEVEDRP